MKSKKLADELTEEELRFRLMQKKNIGRDARILSYRASGRVVDEENAPINAELSWHEPGKEPSVQKIQTPAKPRLDKILLIIEIVAIIGILIMIVAGSQILRSLNQEAERAFVLPTLTPTPLIRAVVLPGGHTPPDESGNVAFNQSEVPEHLRHLVGQSEPTRTVSNQSGSAIRIRIPSINVDAPVVQGDDWESLKNGVGTSTYSSAPGRNGNVILSGHNDIFGQVFRDLEQLTPGDEIILLTEKEAYTYIVQGTQIVQPNQVEVLSQTSDPSVTLISCYPYLVDNQRIVVSGKLKQ